MIPVYLDAYARLSTCVGLFHPLLKCFRSTDLPSPADDGLRTWHGWYVMVWYIHDPSPLPLKPPYTRKLLWRAMVALFSHCVFYTSCPFLCALFSICYVFSVVSCIIRIHLSADDITKLGFSKVFGAWVNVLMWLYLFVYYSGSLKRDSIWICFSKHCSSLFLVVGSGNIFRIFFIHKDLQKLSVSFFLFLLCFVLFVFLPSLRPGRSYQFFLIFNFLLHNASSRLFSPTQHANTIPLPVIQPTQTSAKGNWRQRSKQRRPEEGTPNNLI